MRNRRRSRDLCSIHRRSTSLLIRLQVVRRRKVIRANDSASNIRIKSIISDERSFWAEEEEDGEQRASEDGNKVERPYPANGICDLADDNGSEEGRAEDGHCRQSHPSAAFVNHVEIAYGCSYECFEGCLVSSVTLHSCALFISDNDLPKQPPVQS